MHSELAPALTFGDVCISVNMILTNNGMYTFIKLLCQFNIYIRKACTYLNSDHHIPVIEYNMLIKYLHY